MNVLDPKRRAAIVACLVEGNSIRSTCRMTGAAKGTVLKLSPTSVKRASRTTTITCAA